MKVDVPRHRAARAADRPASARATGGHPTTAGQLSSSEFTALRNRLSDRLARLCSKLGLDFNQTAIVVTAAWRDATEAFAGGRATAADIRQVYADARAQVVPRS